MQKTIISHFYNEEYLLPQWLGHHKKFFDHGILIDYNSTDSSCDIIKTICPEWTVIKTKNEYFDSKEIDIEISQIEKDIEGWKICLNTTEFLVGDYSILSTINQPTQLFIGNYVFVDEYTKHIDNNSPIYYQFHNGYHSHIRGSNLGLGDRQLRSLHNKQIKYPSQGGRHFTCKESTDNLYIFYYAYLIGIEEIINRKIQIKNKISKYEIKRLSRHPHHPNMVTRDSFIEKIKKYQLPKCKDMRVEISRLISLQDQYIVN